MTLTKYKAKRNLKKSGEPSAKVEKSKSKKISREQKLRGGFDKGKQGFPLFVVQKHHASHLHWDFRLEMNGVLKSWAVPKKPPKEKGIKRLAIHVEDHPISYGKFEGEIKEGYGKGTVKIWDSGFYELKDKDAKKIEVILHGKKMKGHYVLIKTRYGNKPEKSWLLFKV